MAKKVITFGEIMLRLAPEGYYRFVQADSFGATYGGGEANVAVSLANYGFDAKFVTKLPAHEIGQAAVNSLRKYGVDTSYIARGGDRVGIYFLEKGASQRPSKVIYDRAGSSIATASKDDFNWEEIFDGAEWFHFTGITPALNDEVAAICLEACKAAKAAGVTVSCDLNYRNKLWSKEKAGQVMGELCKYVDVCIANEEDASDVFGIKAADTDVTKGEVNHEGYKDVAKQLADRFGFSKVAITLRESISANDNKWSAMLYDGKDFCFSKILTREWRAEERVVSVRELSTQLAVNSRTVLKAYEEVEDKENYKIYGMLLQAVEAYRLRKQEQYRKRCCAVKTEAYVNLFC